MISQCFAMLSYIWSLTVMLVVWCPQHNNMPQCLAMFTQIPNYYHDFRGFRPPNTPKPGT
jgi:hypothetical protein